MANQLWRGDATAVAQVATVTVTAFDVTTIYSININGKLVSVLGITSAAGTAAALQTALAASGILEFLEVTWTYPGSGAVITGTAATAGVPFTATSSVSGGTGTIGAVTTTVTSTGPNDWNTASNWSTGTVPVNADVAWLQNSASSILYGLAQSGVTLTAINQDSTFTGTVGLPRNNLSGYVEYRPTYLAIGVTTLNVGTNPGIGAGCGRFKINLGSVQSAINIFSTGSQADAGLPAIILKGTHASNVLVALQGTIGVAIEAGDVSTILTVQVGFQRSQQTDVTLTLGTGCTLTTISQYGGVVYAASNVTTWNCYDGTAWFTGSATLTTLDIEEGGTFYYQSSGTLTTGTVGVGCTLDYSRDPRLKTITNVTVYGTYIDSNKIVTNTNPIYCPNGMGSGGATLNLGANFHLLRS